MVNMLHRKIRANDGFGVSKVATSRLQTRNTENRQKIRRCGIINIVYTMKIHNSWYYCFTNPLDIGTRVSLSHQEASVETIKLTLFIIRR